jgi:hypothetical protein
MNLECNCSAIILAWSDLGVRVPKEIVLFFAEKELKNVKEAVTFEPLPSFVLRAFSSQLRGAASNSDVASADLSHVDGKLVSSMHMFQRQGVE